MKTIPSLQNFTTPQMEKIVWKFPRKDAPSYPVYKNEVPLSVLPPW